MKEISKDTLETNLKEATHILLEMARNMCWNTISSHVVYFISETRNDIHNSIKFNNQKELKSLPETIAELEVIYENLYDINLYIYNSEKKRTIIEIQYYPKSLLELDYYETVKNKEPMLHCKVKIPNYRKNDSEKFDINWTLGGIRHKWNSFFK
ncbi:hypothetical protein C8N46_101104 [Kordia periserrulae]|uniref:Uncharacterized protein n=1 Tax=Kordia periserrulae TaxID=701523 RepID=A0A2T6C599_9FLAO|nr:hypothetical protein [Kordia periserrulae]PTX63504.1 hypothetical protein C8N46_101104 [Kordia periserrulae]